MEKILYKLREFYKLIKVLIYINISYIILTPHN